MAKTVKVADIILPGNYNATCIKHTEDRYNPFWLYWEWNDIGKYGVTHHRKLVAKYADMVSVLLRITSMAKGEV